MSLFITSGGPQSDGEVIIANQIVPSDVPVSTNTSTLTQGVDPTDPLMSARMILDSEELMGELYWSESAIRVSGERYVLITRPGPGGVTSSFLVDLLLRRVADRVEAGTYDVDVGDFVVFVGPGDVRYYRRDSPTIMMLPGSQLSRYESYDSQGRSLLTPRLTHTDRQLTLAVFSTTEMDRIDGYDEDGDPLPSTLPRKIGERALSLPQN
ncbi:MAG TPA: hypothetical protein VF617_01360 [Sphingomonas sp.]